MWYLIVVVLLGIIAWLVFNKKPENFNLVSKQEGRLKKGLEYLQTNGTITNEKYREMVGVTARQAVRDLDELEKQGIVEQVGTTGRNTKYRKK